MYIEIGHPHRLSDLALTCPELQALKQNIKIAVIDDQPFVMANALRAHGFQITEIGGDIRSIDQVMAYPIVICDIKGVGISFESRLEGAHVLSEIRKAYPDKYLITYTGMQYDISYNSSLASADVSATKDANIELWISLIETGLKQVGDPKARWQRFRRTLIDKGIDAYDLFKLETAFVKSIHDRSSKAMIQHNVPEEVKDIVKAFAKIALTQIIEHISKN